MLVIVIATFQWVLGNVGPLLTPGPLAKKADYLRAWHGYQKREKKVIRKPKIYVLFGLLVAFNFFLIYFAQIFLPLPFSCFPWLSLFLISSPLSSPLFLASGADATRWQQRHRQNLDVGF